MTLRERMFYLIEKEGLNPNQFYTVSGLGNGYLDKIGESFRKPTVEKIQKSFPNWNIEWILYEKGEPFIEVLEKEFIPNAHAVENISYMEVPIVHVHAKCGYLSGYGDKEYISKLPTMPVIVDKTYLGKYMILKLKEIAWTTIAVVRSVTVIKFLEERLNANYGDPNCITMIGTSLLYIKQME